MQLTDNGFVISGYEILYIILSIYLLIFMIKLFKMTLKIRGRYNEDKVDNYLGSKMPSDAFKSNDHHGSTSYSDGSHGSDTYIDNDLDVERRDKVIFEEIISGVKFRYDEESRILSITKMRGLTNTDVKPIEMVLENGIEDFREFVDRLEQYVDE